jgi:hypothetical protein
LIGFYHKRASLEYAIKHTAYNRHANHQKLDLIVIVKEARLTILSGIPCATKKWILKTSQQQKYIYHVLSKALRHTKVSMMR